MKVAELKKGMMLTTYNKYLFTKVSSGWLRVYKPRKKMSYTSKKNEKKNEKQIAIYLGTKKDISNTDVTWSDRFVMFENEVLAVDPPAWRYIAEMK
tara:strand:- start:286 stop:573 length:288 start_codon:yes stop_codon:yes gene_type:complete